MADNDDEPKGKKTDRRVLVVTVVVAAVILALFLIFDFGLPSAPDTNAGGPDADFSAPRQPEETAPTTPQNEG